MGAGTEQRTKRCITCRTDKPRSEYHRNRKKPDGLQNECRPCRHDRYRQSYEQNPEIYYERSRRNRERVRQWLRDYKATRSCEDCGESDPRCLDFHHRDPDEKLGHISEMACQAWSPDRIQAEIDKCVVLCANCHRKHTFAKR